MALTVYDVAKKAGVSIATISRVINNSSLVKEETRVEIKKLIEKLGYRPSVLAQRLSSQKTNTIGLVSPQMSQLFSSYYFLEILRGVEEEAHQQNYGLSLHVPRDSQGGDYLRILEERRVDGLILVAISMDDPGLAKIEKTKYPVVLINSQSKSVSCVDVDNVAAGIRAVEHLAQHGRKKIAMLNGVISSVNGRDRYNGYLKAMKKRGFSVNKEWVLDGQFNQERAYDLMRGLIQKNQIPEAVFSANDQMAFGAIQALKESGIPIPDEVAVIGFDDSPSAQIVEPSLTTFRQPIFELGKRAVRIVLELLNKKSGGQTRKEIVPAELITRRSCGCAA